jgi:hypothetical protein
MQDFVHLSLRVQHANSKRDLLPVERQFARYGLLWSSRRNLFPLS